MPFRLLDLSQPLFHDAPNCPTHPPVKVEILADYPDSGWRLEGLSLASHTGSHVDAPSHRMPDGKTLDDLPLETFVGPAYIADLRAHISPDMPIGAAALAECLPEAPSAGPDPLAGNIVLLATGWGGKRAKTDEWLRRSPYLAVEGADYLAGRGVRGVGIDHFSVGGMTAENERTHEALLGRGIWILEELNFPDAAFELPQPATLWALPVNLGNGASGSFCRPVLVVPGGE
jgi:Predicted metal-dependent hydrolase